MNITYSTYIKYMIYLVLPSAPLGNAVKGALVAKEGGNANMSQCHISKGVYAYTRVFTTNI